MTLSSLAKEKEKLFSILKKDAFFKERILLSSGKESDYYFDARRVTLKAEGVYLTAKIMLDNLKGINYDAVGGPTLGADAILGAIGVLSFQANKPINTFIIRKSPKSHGKKKQIEGPDVPQGSRVVLIDDVATTGKAFVESIDILTQAKIRIVSALCIIDRQEGAKETLAKYGCPLVSIFKAQEFLK